MRRRNSVTAASEPLSGSCTTIAQGARDSGASTRPPIEVAAAPARSSSLAVRPRRTSATTGAASLRENWRPASVVASTSPSASTRSTRSADRAPRVRSTPANPAACGSTSPTTRPVTWPR